MTPFTEGKIVLIDYAPLIWWFLLALLVTALILLWVVWSGWKNRGNNHKAERAKRILQFTAGTIFLYGCIEFILLLANTFEGWALPSTINQKAVMLGLTMASSLQRFAVLGGLSGAMFLLSLTMPWNRNRYR